MFRFARCIAGVLLAVSMAMRANAQLEVTTPESEYTRVSYSVSINGADVSEGSTFYISRDGTVFASAPDLASWGLRYQLEPAFKRDGISYFGLQSQLNLAAAVARPEERLTIIAPPRAFIGGPSREVPPATPGGGVFLNYDLRYNNATAFPAMTSGTYGLFFTRNASALQVNFASRQTSRGLSFVRQPARFYRLNVAGNSIFQVGESSVNAGDVGEPASYLGVRLASRFVDPLFITHALPSVTGVARTPSLVEVYINDVLQWREQVDAGPFIINDLPPSAAYNDVDLVITDAQGNQTTEVVRPDVDQGFLRPGLFSYNLDAGLGRVPRAGAPRYSAKAPVVSATVRYGLTPNLTLQAMGETLAGVPFAAAGFEMRLSEAQQATLWYGNGKFRRRGFAEYSLSKGKLYFSERLGFQSEIEHEPDLDFGNFTDAGTVSSRFSHDATVRYSPNYHASFELRLNRQASSRGQPVSIVTLNNTLYLNGFSLSLTPRYDAIYHNLGVSLVLGQTLSMTRSLHEAVQKPAGQPVDATLEYRKTYRDMDDPLSYNVRTVLGTYDERYTRFDDRMVWAQASLSAQQRANRGTIQGGLFGGMALVHGGLHLLPERYAEQSLGVAHLRGFPGVAVTVNGSRAGSTDKNGNVVLTRLLTLQANSVEADISKIPIAVGVKVPFMVVPLPATPVSVDLLEPQAQSIILRVVDALGDPLAPASHLLAEDGASFPIGLDGHAYLHGLSAGTHTFSSDNAGQCKISVAFAPRWEIVDAGTLTCR